MADKVLDSGGGGIEGAIEGTDGGEIVDTGEIEVADQIKGAGDIEVADQIESAGAATDDGDGDCDGEYRTEGDDDGQVMVAIAGEVTCIVEAAGEGGGLRVAKVYYFG